MEIVVENSRNQWTFKTGRGWAIRENGALEIWDKDNTIISHFAPGCWECVCLVGDVPEESNG